MHWLIYYQLLHGRLSPIVAPLRNIPMIYSKYLTKYKVTMHDGAIRKLLYGCAYDR